MQPHGHPMCKEGTGVQPGHSPRLFHISNQKWNRIPKWPDPTRSIWGQLCFHLSIFCIVWIFPKGCVLLLKQGRKSPIGPFPFGWPLRGIRGSPPPQMKLQPVSCALGASHQGCVWPVPTASSAAPHSPEDINPSCCSCSELTHLELSPSLWGLQLRSKPCCLLTGPVFVSLGAQAHPTTQRRMHPAPPFVTVGWGAITLHPAGNIQTPVSYMRRQADTLTHHYSIMSSWTEPLGMCRCHWEPGGKSDSSWGLQSASLTFSHLLLVSGKMKEFGEKSSS